MVKMITTLLLKQFHQARRCTNFTKRGDAPVGGFTLLETLIVLAVLAILATIIVSGLASFRETAALNQAVDETLELLREARSKTLGSEGASGHGVRFDPAAVTLFKTGIYNPADPANLVVNLPALVEISGNTLNTTTASVYFERLTGAARTCGVVQFRTKRSGRTANVRIFGSGLAVLGTTLAVSSGSYVGNGLDDRLITGVGFQPDALIVKGDTDSAAVLRTSTMGQDASKRLVGSDVFTPDHIQAFGPGSFTIGKNERVNDTAKTFHWIAFQAAAGELTIGSYTGNGGIAQSITGIGFSPEYVMVASAQDKEAVHRSSTMPQTYFFNADDGAANRITSFDADGFSVGNSSRVNSSGVVYHYAAWNAVPGKMAVGSYAGNGIDNRAITGVGFGPEYVIVRADDSEETVHKSQSTGAAVDTTMDFRASDNDPNEIQALLADGFEVGTDVQTNASGDTYHWIAFAGLGTGCQ